MRGRLIALMCAAALGLCGCGRLPFKIVPNDDAADVPQATQPDTNLDDALDSPTMPNADKTWSKTLDQSTKAAKVGAATLEYPSDWTMKESTSVSGDTTLYIYPTAGGLVTASDQKIGQSITADTADSVVETYVDEFMGGLGGTDIDIVSDYQVTRSGDLVRVTFQVEGSYDYDLRGWGVVYFTGNDIYPMLAMIPVDAASSQFSELKAVVDSFKVE